MNPRYSIEVGTADDVPQLVTLMEKYWSFEGLAGFEAVRMSRLLGRVLSQPNLGTVWAARDGRDLLGYLIAVYVFSFEYQGLVAEVDELFVLPRARRHGVGTALLDVAETGLANAGCTCIQLQLGTANGAALAFYRRRGYAARDGYKLFDKELAAAAVERISI
jgi:ribosomal protein S18 acetylase RimI-like enzyme